MYSHLYCWLQAVLLIPWPQGTEYKCQSLNWLLPLAYYFNFPGYSLKRGIHYTRNLMQWHQPRQKWFLFIVKATLQCSLSSWNKHNITNTEQPPPPPPLTGQEWKKSYMNFLGEWVPKSKLCNRKGFTCSSQISANTKWEQSKFSGIIRIIQGWEGGPE